MSESHVGMIDAAKGLARNPLCIIALFIVLVYGFASLVTAFAGSFTHDERLPLIYFLFGFPILVLVIFAWSEKTSPRQWSYALRLHNMYGERKGYEVQR
jgi:hypothetical protein